jgi:glutamate/tyrosine decarboxylase-like PLP-dependent enzyme
MGSSIAIYAALQAFGKEGYQQILANYVRVNLAFRAQLAEKTPMLQVVNESNIGPVTAFRLYPEGFNWKSEQSGSYTQDQIEYINGLNASLFEIIGEGRDEVFFGDTTRVCTVNTSDTKQQIPVAAAKFFSISPYTETEHISDMIHFLQQKVKVLEDVKVEYSQQV